MWIHLLIVRRAIARSPLVWSLRFFATVLLVLLVISAWWTGTSRVADLERQASQLALDVILMPDVDPDAGSVPAQECRDDLRRRPEVASANLLGKHAVWRLFQYELGMWPGGLTDVATMPAVVKVQLRPQYATLKHARNIRSFLLSNHHDVIDRVLIPELAFRELELLSAQTRMIRSWTTMFAGLLLCVGLAMTAQAMRLKVLIPPLHAVLGKGPHWGLTSVITCMALLLVSACAVALGCIHLLSSHIQMHVPWLCSAYAMFEV